MLFAILKIILYVIGGLLALLFALLAALLFCAVWYRADVRKGDKLEGAYRARWLFLTIGGTYIDGELKNTVRVFGIPLPQRKGNKDSKKMKKGGTQKPKRKKPQKKDKPKKSFIERLKDLYASYVKVLETGEFGKLPSYTKELLKKLYRAVKPKRLEAKGVLGFEDPSNTALAVGAVGGFAVYKGWDIHVSGDFETPRIEGAIKAKGRFRLSGVVFPVIGYIFKKPVRAILFGRK